MEEDRKPDHVGLMNSIFEVAEPLFKGREIPEIMEALFALSAKVAERGFQVDTLEGIRAAQGFMEVWAEEQLKAAKAPAAIKSKKRSGKPH